MTTFQGNTDDFLMDDEFNDFVLNNKDKKNKSWEDYFDENPELKKDAEKARKIILGLNSLEDSLSEKEVTESQLNKKFEETWKKYRESKSKKVVSRASVLIWRIAAVAAVIVFAVTFYSVINNVVFKPDKGVVYSEIYVPSAKQSRLTLPDGSIVWINSETKIKYSNRFDNKERNIYLDGEAYFEVSHNEKLPFKVFSNDAIITVTGTKFNVRAYFDEKKVETVLVEGKVELGRSDVKSERPIELKPGDKATYNLDTRKVSITRDDVDVDIAWKDGKLIFRNTPLAEVCKTLERRYDAEIILDDNTGSLREHPFTFTVIGENLPLVLEYLCQAAPLKFYTEYVDEDGEKGIEHIRYTILLK